MAEKIVAIHQPNFLPWLGYFAKIASSDVFVVMDNAQFPKKGGSWSNRVKLSVAGEPTWVTVPIVRAYHGVRAVREMEIDENSPWRPKLLKTIRMNYAKAPYINDVFPLLEEIISFPSRNLSEFNLFGIRRLANALGMDSSKLVLGSDLGVGGAATDLLINMVTAAGGSTYLCGGGASGYQDDNAFSHAGIHLQYQSFVHPEYRQGSGEAFQPGLSIADALLWCGIERTAGLVTVPTPATRGI
jgi:hypothetical protein